MKKVMQFYQSYIYNKKLKKITKTCKFMIILFVILNIYVCNIAYEHCKTNSIIKICKYNNMAVHAIIIVIYIMSSYVRCERVCEYNRVYIMYVSQRHLFLSHITPELFTHLAK